MTLPIEKQVVSLKYAKILHDLGVPQESVWVWAKSRQSAFPNVLLLRRFDVEQVNEKESWAFGYDIIAATFTVAELGEMLPERTEFLKTRGEKPYNTRCLKKLSKNFEEEKTEWFSADTEANSRVKLLIYLIQNNLLDVKKI